MKQIVLRTALALAFASLLQPVVAMDHSSHAAPVAKAANQVLSEGKVRRLDRGAGSVTITHGPIENLGMGAMTMTFSFKQGVVPASVKDGDQVRFRAEEKDSQYTVVRVVPAK
ncbi:MAG: copper-binding protein [Sulfuritalea sp.]|jgi:Cu(I)/Ag(I) efflux system protein CusF|nr:copper-binding protein [Sulfuritalea sp.]MBK9351294.1 copper-binding protein [Sulfuritalea sp.]